MSTPIPATRSSETTRAIQRIINLGALCISIGAVWLLIDSMPTDQTYTWTFNMRTIVALALLVYLGGGMLLIAAVTTIIRGIPAVYVMARYGRKPQPCACGLVSEMCATCAAHQQETSRG